MRSTVCVDESEIHEPCGVERTFTTRPQTDLSPLKFYSYIPVSHQSHQPRKRANTNPTWTTQGIISSTSTASNDNSPSLDLSVLSQSHRASQPSEQPSVYRATPADHYRKDSRLPAAHPYFTSLAWRRGRRRWWRRNRRACWSNRSMDSK